MTRVRGKTRDRRRSGLVGVWQADKQGMSGDGKQAACLCVVLHRIAALSWSS